VRVEVKNRLQKTFEDITESDVTLNKETLRYLRIAQQ